VKYGMIGKLRHRYPVALMCRVLNVSESGFHAWRARPPCRREQENARLEIEIRAAHQRTRKTYGVKRLHRDLADHNVETTPYRVRILRKKLGLRCKQKHKFRVTTDSKHDLPFAPNVLKREFALSAPDKAWVSDITFIHTEEGWLYLAGVKDLFSGELVGYAMSERITRELVMRALFHATANRHPEKGLIVHSDRGSQYCAQDYQKLLKQFGMIASMSRKGDCWDNAPMESFWGTLKNELVHHRRFRTRQQAVQEVTEYIEIFYNRQRKQKRLNYLSPVEFTRQYFASLLAA
jgi:putative transposase